MISYFDGRMVQFFRRCDLYLFDHLAASNSWILRDLAFAKIRLAMANGAGEIPSVGFRPLPAHGPLPLVRIASNGGSQPQSRHAASTSFMSEEQTFATQDVTDQNAQKAGLASSASLTDENFKSQPLVIG